MQWFQPVYVGLSGTDVAGRSLRGRKPGGITAGPVPQSTPHPCLRAEHPLLIGGKDQGLLAGQVVRLGADVPFSIEEQHPQQPACRIKELH